MTKIKKLDAFTANRIAAGEVVERPVSIVKELVENAIDADSSSVVVEIQNGGIRSIRVSDNGNGIAFDDAPVAFERHATSKISTSQDLDAIETLGFRGEALCAIAAVSQVDLQSHIPAAETGVSIRVAGGEMLAYQASGCPNGTTVTVENLFFNTPARLKFLKRPASEAGAIGDYMVRMIMAHPEISFKYIQNDRVMYHSMGDGELLHALYCVYGREVLSHVKKVDFTNDHVSIQGFVSTSEGSKANRTYQSFFVNGRYIQSALLSAAMQGAFGTRLMGGRFPLCALNVAMPYDDVDVNIHPNKMAVRFKHEEEMVSAMKQAIEVAIVDKEIRNWPMPSHQKATPENEGNRRVFKSSIIHIGNGTQSKFPDEIEQMKDEIWLRSKSGKTEKVSADEKTDASMTHGEPSESEEPLTSNKPFEPNEPSKSDEVLEASQAEEQPEPNKVDDAAIRKIEIPDEPTKGVFYVKESLSLEMQPPFIPDTAEIQWIGQVFATYVVVQQGEDLFFIDQHAAHERMLFDRIGQQAEKFEAQQMLHTIHIQLTPGQMAALTENTVLLRNFGFDWTETDANTLAMKSVPYIFGEAESVDFLQEVLDAFHDMRTASVVQMKQNTLAQYACKHATKGEQTLTKTEIGALLKQFETVKEYHCPHGRPIILRMSKKEIEKAFQRIV